MYWFVLLVVFIFILSQLISERAKQYANVHVCISNDFVAKISYLIMIFVLTLFSGLRTSYADTPVYMNSFASSAKIITESSFVDFFSSYGGWDFFNNAIKTFIGDNPHTVIVLSSFLYVVLSLSFIRRFSYNFSLTVFLFTITSYVSEMNGIKQMLSISIAFFSIYALFNKKIIFSIILMLLAMSFHPYVIIMYSAVFLKDKVLDWRSILFSIAIILFALFGMDIVYSLFNMIGKDYNGLYTLNTINLGRVIFELIPIILIIINRKKINSLNDKMLIVMCNLQVASYMFLLIATRFNPVMSGRMQMYFSMFSFVLIPKLIVLTFPRDILGRIIVYGLYFIYCILDLTKLGTFSFFTNRFNQVSILDALTSVNIFSYLIFIIFIAVFSFVIQRGTCPNKVVESKYA